VAVGQSRDLDGEEHGDAAAAGFLGLVEGLVGGGEEGLHVPPVVRKERPPNAHAEHDGRAWHGPLDGLLNPACQGVEVLAGGETAADDGEFVAAKADGHVVVAHHLL
jgi:hypothetical protein